MTQDAPNGLDAMQAILKGDAPAPPMAEALGYRLHSVEKGRVVFRGAPDARFTNPMGTVHGGWYGTLLDSAMGCAVMTDLAPGASYTTLEYKVNILRSIPLGHLIDAVAWTNHVGRRTGVANSEIRGVSDGKLYATGSTTCLVLPPPPEDV